MRRGILGGTQLFRYLVQAAAVLSVGLSLALLFILWSLAALQSAREAETPAGLHHCAAYGGGCDGTACCSVPALRCAQPCAG